MQRHQLQQQALEQQAMHHHAQPQNSAQPCGSRTSSGALHVHQDGEPAQPAHSLRSQSDPPLSSFTVHRGSSGRSGSASGKHAALRAQEAQHSDAPFHSNSFSANEQCNREAQADRQQAPQPSPAGATASRLTPVAANAGPAAAVQDAVKGLLAALEDTQRTEATVSRHAPASPAQPKAVHEQRSEAFRDQSSTREAQRHAAAQHCAPGATPGSDCGAPLVGGGAHVMTTEASASASRQGKQLQAQVDRGEASGSQKDQDVHELLAKMVSMLSERNANQSPGAAAEHAQHDWQDRISPPAPDAKQRRFLAVHDLERLSPPASVATGAKSTGARRVPAAKRREEGWDSRHSMLSPAGKPARLRDRPVHKVRNYGAATHAPGLHGSADARTAATLGWIRSGAGGTGRGSKAARAIEAQLRRGAKENIRPGPHSALHTRTCSLSEHHHTCCVWHGGNIRSE